MTEVATIAPVRKTLSVNCSPERAFEVFTAEVASWWPTTTHSIHHEDVTDVVLEPRVDGELYELAEGGKRAHWGRVTAWEPPRRLVITWANASQASDPSAYSRVTFEIEEYEDMVRLTVTHDELVAGSGMAIGISKGWPVVLASLKSLLETGQGLDVFAKPKSA